MLELEFNGVLGCGVDLVDVQSFGILTQDLSSEFVKQHFTLAELDYAQGATVGPTQVLATRYAAKEALIKATEAVFLFRNSPLRSVNYCEIEVLHDAFHRPYFSFYGEWLKMLQQLNAHALLSLSHEVTSALAFVILQRNTHEKN